MASARKFFRFSLYVAVFLVALACSLYLTSKWIIKGEAEVVVPALVGHDTVYALDLLTSLGLNIKVSGFEWSESVPKNFIAFQDPNPGTRLKRDRNVKVVLSRGSKRVRVPNLVGSRLREAELVISQNGLLMGDLCVVPSSKYPQQTIIAQRPEPLREVERGQGVNLLVSEGSEHIATAMPELRHQTLSQAMEALQGLNLAPTAIKDVYNPGEPLNVIVSQRPVSGYRVDTEDSIVLVVNRIKQRREPQSRFWWIAYLVPEGYFKREVVLYQQIEERAVPIYRGILSPGEEIQWLAWARSPDEVSIYVDGLPQEPDTSGFHWGRVGRLSLILDAGEIVSAPFVHPGM
jgi:beta-lactam-binding protein with PASTA domain